MTIKLKRIYDIEDETGISILTDRIWPRGISKEKANLDYWLKDVAPTSELRKWFNHDTKLYGAFKEKYKKELRENQDQKNAFDELKDITKKNDEIILLFGAKDETHNQAVILKELLEK